MAIASNLFYVHELLLLLLVRITSCLYFSFFSVCDTLVMCFLYYLFIDNGRYWKDPFAYFMYWIVLHTLNVSHSKYGWPGPLQCNLYSKNSNDDDVSVISSIKNEKLLPLYFQSFFHFQMRSAVYWIHIKFNFPPWIVAITFIIGIIMVTRRKLQTL